MWSYRSIPFVIISISFLTGILLYQYPLSLLGFLMGLAILFIWLHRHYQHTPLRKKLYTFGCLVLLPALGYFNAYLMDPIQSGAHFSKMQKDHPLTARVIVEESGTTSGGYTRLEGRIVQCMTESNPSVKCDGKVLIYTDMAFDENAVIYGKSFLITATFKEIPAAANPHAFDYQKFMSRKGIYHQAFANQEDIIELDGFYGNKMIAFAKSLQLKSLKILEKHISGEAEMAVLAALLLGEKTLLPDEVKDNYVATGATHVLAVSGLHTGIIAGAVLWVLQFIRRNNFLTRISKCVIALSILWLFVMVTGMAPSVLRAATMFSFILVGKLLIKRPVNIFNIIGLSAFLLILFDPMIIYQVGFQLSYCALIGIIVFQDKIYRSIYVPTKFLQACWSLTSLSLAAQLGTLPLTIFYFNMFPTYFWLSGIFVVPMAGVLLKLGMVTLISQMVLPGITPFLAYLLEIIVWWMNTLVNVTTLLPGVKTEGLWIEKWQMILLFLSIGTAALGWHAFKTRLIFVSVGIVFVLIVSGLVTDLLQSTQRTLTVYHIKGGTVIDYFDGKNCICTTNASMDDPSIKYAVQRNRWAHGIGNCEIIQMNTPWETKTARYSDKTIYLGNGTAILIGSQVQLSDADLSLYDTLSDQIDAMDIQLVLDGSSFSDRFQLKNRVDHVQLPVWDTYENGALILKK